MDIKASDLTWAEVNFSDTDEAQQALTEIEKEIRETKRAIRAGTTGLDERLARLEELPPGRRGVRRQLDAQHARGHPDGGAADHLRRKLDAHVGALRVVDEVPRLLRQPGRVALEREQPRRRGWGLRGRVRG